ncbi:hypothetical protein DIPPA_09749 [Diplonema papillatum]|nr:hypothetical protein DIPPA_09749 [Diplonema papillatum]
MDKAPYQCQTAGWVLRHDSPGLLCVDYTQGDEYAGACNDNQCCAPSVCSAYTCKTDGYVMRDNSSDIDCLFECNDVMCCRPTGEVPKHHAQGIMFVDLDPDRFEFGGTLQVMRALDESDITHYRIYWGFSREIRKVPSCGVNNPVSWTTAKWYDSSKMLAEVPVTGFDISIEIPMNTTPDARCPISWDRLQRTTSATDPCNPHYWFAVSVNENGEKDILNEMTQQVGPRHPIKDYEEEYVLPCIQGGIVYGHDLPASDDVVLGSVDSAEECAQLCRDHTGNPPCQWWTWAYPTGGPTAKKCWIEGQMMQQSHYGVRVVGPRVCPTGDDDKPTGYERTRCDRWIRYQNMAPFNSETSRSQWMSQSRLIMQKPQLPDVPLGPYNYAEACHAICDMDPICLGVVFMKRDPTDTYFHKCWLMHVNTQLLSYVTYDTWICSRENMAPLLNGYQLQKNPFGYTTCSASPLVEEESYSVDCCAASCDRQGDSCSAFTYSNVKNTCALYNDCGTLTKVDGVTSCAYASCYDGAGAATYTRETNEKWSIVDRWPDTFINNDGTITIAIQASPGLEGAQVTCAVIRVDKPFRTAVPVTVDEFLAANIESVTGVIEEERALMYVATEAGGEALYLGQNYKFTCVLHNAAALGTDEAQTWSTKTRDPMNFHYTGLGYCKPPAADGCTQEVVVLEKVDWRWRWNLPLEATLRLL